MALHVFSHIKDYISGSDSTHSAFTHLDKHIPTDIASYRNSLVLGLCSVLISASIYALSTVRKLQTQIEDPRGCRRLGLTTISNLTDEFDEKYSTGTTTEKDEEGRSAWEVKGLFIHPVKSCRAVELSHGTVLGTGLAYDRQFSFAQLELPETDTSPRKWKFITQRQFPLLATVETEVWVPDPSSSTYSTSEQSVQSGGVIVISFPSPGRGLGFLVSRALSALGVAKPQEYRERFEVPYDPNPEQIRVSHYPLEEMAIWKDRPRALNMSSHVPLTLLQRHLGMKRPIALLRVARDHTRKVFRCAPRKEELGYQPTVGFADAYPLHLLNLASVKDVAMRLEKGAPRLSARNFRANIVFSGAPAYIEDSWKRIRIGGFEYHVSCRTGRCKLPNTNQITGEKHKSEPDKTLRSFRCIDEGAKGTACLGMQMVPALEFSQVRVGDKIEVLETGEHFYLKQ